MHLFMPSFDALCVLLAQLQDADNDVLCCVVSVLSEYMPGGNLYDFLHKRSNFLELVTILKIAISISKGMDYLHQNDIIHRDLKTANLLISYDQV
jgi:serine/threonine protein kinase